MHLRHVDEPIGEILLQCFGRSVLENFLLGSLDHSKSLAIELWLTLVNTSHPLLCGSGRLLPRLNDGAVKLVEVPDGTDNAIRRVFERVYTTKVGTVKPKSLLNKC